MSLMDKFQIKLEIEFEKPIVMEDEVATRNLHVCWKLWKRGGLFRHPFREEGGVVDMVGKVTWY